MKVVNIIQRYHPAIGGSETWCQGIARYLSGQGVDVKVLTMDVFNEDEYWVDPPLDNCTARLGRIEYDNGVLVKRYKRTKIGPLAFSFFKFIVDRKLKIYFYGPHSIEMYLRLFREVQEADIVHLHTMPYPHNFFGYFIGRHFGKKIVITPHFHPGHPFYERSRNYWLMKNCDSVFAVSNYEKEYLAEKGLKSAKIFTIYNAIDPKDYEPKDLSQFKMKLFEKYGMKEETKKILFVGRKVDYKGVDVLIEAVKGIKADFRLFLVGPDYPWFDEFYSRLSPEEKKKIINLGVVTHQEKVNLLHLCDLLALPSKFEAFGIVFLEAWVCAKPVIGTNSGTMPKLIKDCGFTSDYGNTVALREKIELLLSDQGLSRGLGLNGQRKVLQHYTWDSVGANIFSILKELNNNGRPR